MNTLAEFEDLRNEMINFKSLMQAALASFQEGTVSQLDAQNKHLRAMEHRLEVMSAEHAALEGRLVARIQEVELGKLQRAKTKVG